MPAVGTDDESSAHFERPVRRRRAHAGDRAAVVDEVGHLRLHEQPEGWIPLPVLGEKVQEVPLRHERHERAVRSDVSEVAHRHRLSADDAADLAHLGVRALEELVEQAELVHDVERRRVHGVAAEVAQEVSVLLQHHDVDAGAGQQESEHHSGGSAAGDAAAGLDRHADCGPEIAVSMYGAGSSPPPGGA